MVVPCAVLPTDCSGWPASCFNGECYSTPTMVRQQRRRSQRSLSSTGTDIPSSRPTFGRAPRASAVREAAQRHWRKPARNVLDSGSTVLRSTGREGAPHASKRRCFVKHSNLITGRKSHHGPEGQCLALQPGLPTNRRERQCEHGFGPITAVPADVFTWHTLTSGLSGASLTEACSFQNCRKILRALIRARNSVVPRNGGWC